MPKKVVTLGEIMLRLSTPDFKRFVQADSFDVTYGGGEANVSAAVLQGGKDIGVCVVGIEQRVRCAFSQNLGGSKRRRHTLDNERRKDVDLERRICRHLHHLCAGGRQAVLLFHRGKGTSWRIHWR